VDGTPKQLAAKPNICAGATARLHSHFFTSDGHFGSVDWTNQQVDDGHYKVVGNTLHIGTAVFRYTISSGRLRLSPVISAGLKRQALAHPLIGLTRRRSTVSFSATVPVGADEREAAIRPTLQRRVPVLRSVARPARTSTIPSRLCSM
jgi:hypothetical protein